MEQTGSQHLPYPDGNDPANWALQLQVLAEAIDAKLVTEFAAFRTTINRPVLVANLSANQTGIAASTTTDVLFDQTLFKAGTWQLDPTYAFPQETGYYRMGAYVVANPSGGVTANSSVYTSLEYAYVPSFPFYSYTTEEFISRNWQSSTGGEHMVVEALVRVDVTNAAPSTSRPTDYSGARVTITHSNVASSLNVIAGSKMWAYKVSELEGI